MPRLLSSYAANKRVEDGLKRKQEQIRQDYVRATHRYLDETEKLVDDLIQINVRTPSAFETSCPSSATFQRPTPNNNSLPFAPYQPCLHVPGPQHHGSAEQLALLRSRSRSNLTNDGATDDGASFSRKEIPLPIVRVRGKDVFYQYENQRSKWKKLEPTYRTKVLLHRNDTVASALKHYSIQRNQESQAGEMKSNRKNSVVSRRESDSIFSRRGSRRDSRYSIVDEEEEDRVPPIIELKPQLSPGHTPRMLNGWTIMNWCLWNKQQTKPVWASKKYIDRKNRELKRFQAARMANRNDLPAKPNSANPSAREARRKESMSEQSPQTVRAKSVPIHKISMPIEEETEEEQLQDFPEPDRNLLRPTTSILRLPREDDEVAAEENRPKTTQAHRRVALDTYTVNEFDTNIHNFNKEKLFYGISDVQHYKTSSKSKTGIMDGKSVKIFEPEYPESDFELLNLNDNHRLSISDMDKPRSKNRIQGLAATEITITGDTVPHKNAKLTPVVPLLKPAKKKNYTSVQATVIFPKVQAVVPQLGSDSPK